MDQIQKILVEAGRKDLAQEYYKKIAQPADPKILIEPELLKDLEADFGKGKFVDIGNFVHFFPEENFETNLDQLWGYRSDVSTVGLKGGKLYLALFKKETGAARPVK